MRKCLDDAGGNVAMLHLPPRTAQLNPTYGGGKPKRPSPASSDCLDRIRDAVRRMIRNVEMPAVKMPGWLPAA